MTDTVVPRLFRGMQDYLPEQMAARQWLIDTIRDVYELYGFVPLATPAIEYLDVLSGSGGTEIQESIFTVKNPDIRLSQTDAPLGLRFDLTVPLARVVAQYRELSRPFRRYQVSPVWRTDKPGAGRFREFTQFDLDSVGVSTPVADVEIITVMCDTLSALKVGPYSVRFSSRKILNLLLKYAEIPDMITVADRGEDVQRPAADVFRVLDKRERVGAEKVRLELTSGYSDESGDIIPGLGLAEAQVAKIEQFVDIVSDRRREVLDRLFDTFADVEGAKEEINVLARMSEQLADLGYGDDRVRIDLSVARGLAYYTGPVFEAVLVEAPQYGSIFAGGRYDDLVLRFLGERVPATGASLGVDRLLAALLDTGRLCGRRATAQVLVATMDSSMTDEYLSMTYELRRAGIATELYLGSNRIGKQIKYADEQGIPLVVLYGEDEKEKGTITLKDLARGSAGASEITERETWIRERPGQIEAPRGDLVAVVSEMLATRRETS